MIKVILNQNNVENVIGYFEQQSDLDSSLPQIIAEGNFGDPSTYQIIQLDISAQLAQAKAIQDAKDLLSSTDWQVIRQMDNGVPMDSAIKAQREAARLIINPVKGS